MKPQLLAVLNAVAWGVGSYFEKKGLHLGQLSLQMGITIRTTIAFLILGAVSMTHQWKTLSHAGVRSLLYMSIGGGVIAGSAGMLCFYVAIKGAPLTRVMLIAFTSPLFGALMGILFGNEPLTVKTVTGTLLTVGGIVLLTIS